MCCAGDIILISDFLNEDGVIVPLHPFVVVDDQEDKIEGVDCENLSYDMVCVLMSSFKSKEHREKMLSYDCNIEVTVKDGVKKDGFLKGNQLHYFDKNNTQYRVVSVIDEKVFNLLIETIQKLNDIIINTQNLVRS